MKKLLMILSMIICFWSPTHAECNIPGWVYGSNYVKYVAMAYSTGIASHILVYYSFHETEGWRQWFCCGNTCMSYEEGSPSFRMVGTGGMGSYYTPWEFSDLQSFYATCDNPQSVLDQAYFAKEVIDYGEILDYLNDELPDGGSGDDLADIFIPFVTKTALSIEPEKSASENDVANATGGDPVSVNNGEYGFSVTDVVISGKALNVAITRTYGSKREYNGRFGFGWDMNYNMKVRRIDGDGSIVLLDGAGARREFTLKVGTTDTYTRDADRSGYLLVNGDDTVTWVKKDSLNYNFDTNGNLIEIVDRHGNNITFDYEQQDSQDVLLAVYGPSRFFHDEQFGGPANGRGLVAMEYMLVKITDDLDREIALDYDDNGLLETITDFDNRLWQYSYDSATNDLLTVTGPATTEAETSNLVTTYEYDYLHRLEKIYDPENTSSGTPYITNNYSGLMVSSQKYGQSEGAGDSTFEFAYDSDHNMATVTARNDKSDTITVYNSAGQVLSETVATATGTAHAAYTTMNEFNSNNELTRTIMPARNCVDFEYDTNGNLTKVTQRPECDNLPFNGDPGGVNPDYISIADSGAYAFGGVDEDFTVAMWLKRQRSSATEYLIDRRDSNECGWRLFFDGTDDRLKLKLYDADTTVITVESATAITDNKWHFVVATIDRDDTASNGCIYIDGGAAEGSTAVGNEVITTGTITNLYLGCSYNGTTQDDYFEGSLDDVMIFNRAMATRADTFGLSAYSEGLIGFWKMNEETGNSVADSSTSDIDGAANRTTADMLTDGKMSGSIAITNTYVTNTASDFDYIKTTTDAKGNTTTFGYDFEDEESDGTTYDYGTDVGDLMWIKYPDVIVPDVTGTKIDTPVVTFTYYDTIDIKNGRVDTVTSADGIVTDYVYYDNSGTDGDSYGHLKSVTIDPSGESITTSYVYDALGHPTEVENDLGEKTGYIYSNLDQLLQVNAPNLTTGAATGFATTMDYDKNKKLWKTNRDFTDGDSTTQTQTIEYSYNLLDALKTIKDPLDNISENEYDDNENNIAVIDAQGRGSYPTTDPDYETEFLYDERNLLVQTTDAEGAETYYSYDANGNLKSIKAIADPSDSNKDQITTYDYDRFDRLVTTTYPDNITTEEFSYDDNGNMTSKQTRLQDIIYFDYDAANRIVRKIIDDDSGLPVLIDDTPTDTGTWTPSEQKGQFSKNCLSSTSSGDTCTFGFTVTSTESYYVYLWSPNGVSTTTDNLTVNIKDNGSTIATVTAVDQTQLPAQWKMLGTTSYTFNTTTASVEIVVQDAGEVAYADAVRLVPTDLKMTEYLYDIAGRIVEIDDDGDTTEYAYDTIGRIDNVTDQNSKVVAYEHDTLGRRTKLEYPDHDEGTYDSYITYHYDKMGRLTDIKDCSATPVVIAHYDYDELSRRTDLYYNLDGDSTYDDTGEDGHIAYDYVDADGTGTYDDDLSNWLEQIANDVDNDATDDLTYDYTYDNVGNRLSVDEGPTTHDYLYDNIYQLIEDDDSTDVYEWDHDPLGNWDWLKLNTVVQTDFSTYDSTDTTDNLLNQYGSVGPSGSRVDYSYDDNGNLTDDGTYAYGYDAENRLISVDSGTTATYTYDHAGRRVSRTYNSVTTKYVYDGQQVIAEYDDSQTQGTFVLVRRFIYGPGIDEPICMIDCTGQSDAWYFYHFDGLGSVVALSNTSGVIVESYSYTAFGETTVTLNGNLDNPYRFTGRRWDDETDLYYYRARMYNPEIGRFLQPDPIGYEGGLNLYTYCGNNPVVYLDPYGLCKQDIRNIIDGIKYDTARIYHLIMSGLWGLEGITSGAVGYIPGKINELSSELPAEIYIPPTRLTLGGTVNIEFIGTVAGVVDLAIGEHARAQSAAAFDIMKEHAWKADDTSGFPVMVIGDSDWGNYGQE